MGENLVSNHLVEVLYKKIDVLKEAVQSKFIGVLKGLFEGICKLITGKKTISDSLQDLKAGIKELFDLSKEKITSIEKGANHLSTTQDKKLQSTAPETGPFAKKEKDIKSFVKQEENRLVSSSILSK